MSDAPAEHDLLTTSEVAAQYRVTEDAVRRWVRDGLIPYTLVGPYRLKRIRRSAVAQTVDAVTPEPKQEAARGQNPKDHRKTAARR